MNEAIEEATLSAKRVRRAEEERLASEDAVERVRQAEEERLASEDAALSVVRFRLRYFYFLLVYKMKFAPSFPVKNK